MAEDKGIYGFIGYNPHPVRKPGPLTEDEQAIIAKLHEISLLWEKLPPFENEQMYGLTANQILFNTAMETVNNMIFARPAIAQKLADEKAKKDVSRS